MRRGDHVDERPGGGLVAARPLHRHVDLELTLDLRRRHVAPVVEDRHGLGEVPRADQAQHVGDRLAGRQVLAELADAPVETEFHLTGARRAGGAWASGAGGARRAGGACGAWRCWRCFGGGFGAGGLRGEGRFRQGPFGMIIGASQRDRPLITDADGEAGHEIGGLPGAFGDRGEAEPRVAHEDLAVGPEAGAGAGDLLRDAAELAQARPPGEAGPGAGLTMVRELARDTAAEAGRPGVTVPVHLDVQARGQGVDHRRPDAVQAAGSGVGAAAELAARVQPGHDQLDAGELGLRLDVDRNAAAVVAHLGGPVGAQDDLDPGAVPGQRLVHRVVEDLPQAVLQPTAIGGADVHSGPFADRVQALENGKMPGGISVRFGSRRGRCSGR